MAVGDLRQAILDALPHEGEVSGIRGSLPLPPRQWGDLRNRVTAVAETVERYAPGAPESIKVEAGLRFFGWLRDSPPAVERLVSDTGDTDEQIPFRGQKLELEFSASPAGFRRSGAMALLSPWKIRHAGVIG